MLTPADLVNSTRKSGYDHVVPCASNNGWQARKGGGRVGHSKRRYPVWRGTMRRDALEAAQDYCDYVNGLPAAQRRKLKSAGHKGRRTSLSSDPEVQAALGVLRDAKGQREGRQGYVYLIIEVNPGGGLTYGKVGYSTNPRARVAELQTGNPRLLRLHLAKPGTLADEAALHAKYAKDNVLQEWFRLTKELLLEWDAGHLIGGTT